MGLFSKKPKVDVNAELDALKERLASSEQAKADLETRLSALDDFNSALNGRLATLDGATTQLDTRLGALGQGFASMGEQLNTLSSSNDRLDNRLGVVDELDVRLRELTDRLNTPISTPPPAPTVPPPPLLAEIAPPPPPPTSDIETLRDQLTAITERMSSVDTRVTSVSTELANQLTELSRDIDDLNQRKLEHDNNPNSVDTTEIEARLTERLDAAIDDVLDSTEKLAAEQARYEIQFRADLAELAERLRRPNAS